MNLYFYSNKYIKGIHYGLDTLTIVIAIFAAQSCNVFGRLSWTEAQA